MQNAFPPGPKSHALLGNLPEFRKDPLNFLSACARQYGDVVYYRILNINVYLLNHPDLIEYVLVRNNRNFIKGRLFRANHLLLGNGLVVSEGDFWRRQRRLVQPAFHRDRLAGYADVIAEYAEGLTSDWQEGETRDIHLEMKRLTLQVIAKTLFNADISNESVVVGSALHTVWEEFTARIKSGLLVPEQIPTPGNLRLRRAVRQVDQIIYRIILERRTSDHLPDDLLSMLLAAQDEDGGQMTDSQLRDEVMTLFLAGHETTAVALTWTWYLLAQHPEIEQRLINELDQVLGGRSPGLTDIPRLAYTDMVLKESMRLYPAVWGIPRIAVQDCEIGGYIVPAGTSLTISQWVMHRDPRYFENPGEFKPERWENDFIKSLPAFVYFPFGGGPRQCIGYSFATMEAILILATIARKFRLRLAPDQMVKPWPSITLYPKNGIKTIVNRRISPLL